MPSKKPYWASLPTEEVLPVLYEKVKQWYEYCQNSNLLELWRRAHRMSYAGQKLGGQMNKEGENSEYTTLAINHYGNLKQHILTMVTSQRQAFESKASNADYQSQAQTMIANSLIETVMRERDLEFVSQQVVDYALMFGEGFCHKEWDFDDGPIVAPEPATARDMQEEPGPDPTVPLPDQPDIEGEQIQPEPSGPPRRAGDVKFTARMGLDVARDPSRDSSDLHDWYIVRVPSNRYDLLAKYPEAEEGIWGANSKVESETDFPRLVTVAPQGEWECDEVFVWVFYHKKCPALPDGRQVAFVSPDCALYDDALKYREMPIYRLSAQEVAGTPLGYSSLFDLLAVQQALNATASTVTSNLAAFGVQNIWVPEGSRITVNQLKGGLKVVTGGNQKPESMDLFSIPPEVLKFMELLERWLETLSGVNSVARGNPEASLKSGSALALVQSQAIQFIALIQKAYIKFLERVSTGTVKDYQEFGDIPHIITITGKGNRQYAAEFTNRDIDKISRVTINVGNPLSNTIAGRVNMVEQLGNLGLIKSPEAYFQVMQTGRLEPVVEAQQAELLLIKSENEVIGKGEVPVAIALENHPLHIKEHTTVLASPDARAEPAVVAAAVKHINEHLKLWRETDPELLALLGVKPSGQGKQVMDQANNEQKMQGMEPGEGGAQPPPQPGPQGPGQTPAPPGMEPSGGKPPRMPSMPKNPMDGQRAPGPQIGQPQ